MAGVLVGTIAPVSYALDAYRDASNEIFIMNMLLKNFLFFGISYVANNWVARDGPFQAFAVCGATSMFLVCLNCPCINLIVVRSCSSDLYLGKETPFFLG